MDLAAVLNYLRPDAEWSLTGNNYANLVWHGPGDPPTQTECFQAWPTVQTELQNAANKASRHSAFVMEADPLFFAWQRDEGTEQAWLDKCAEIRERFPYA